MPPTHNIKIELEIHVITCPGVWLCRNDNIELTITTLGYKFKAIPLPPRFPLCYHEKFVMDGYFSDVNDNADLEKALDEEPIVFTLWQKGRRLAYYSNKIGVVLNYTGCLSYNFDRTDNSIIMTKGSCFPGTIAPKIEYTASIQFVQKCMNCNRSTYHRHGQKRCLKNLYENGNKVNESFFRQKPVCHTKLKQRWRHLGESSSVSTFFMRRNCNNDENESIFCDHCLATKDNDNHALPADNNNNNFMHSHSNEDSSYANTLTQTDPSCSHMKLNGKQSNESYHTQNTCSICLKYRWQFNGSSGINVTRDF